MLAEGKSVYVSITEQIVAALEKGVGTWKMPWNNGNCSVLPINAVSRKPYRGINTLALWSAMQQKGYNAPEWATYKQWQNLGGQVRKGEKSTLVVFWKFVKRQEPQDDEDHNASDSKFLFARSYSVFNADQVDGYTPVNSQPAPPKVERLARADEFFNKIAADVRHCGNRAFYSITGDFIQMPTFESFDDPGGFYGTLAHEHIHWSGKAGRCDRECGKRFGDNAYAVEELVAELGAAFVCANLELSSEPREDHAQYLQSWLKVLKSDSRAIFSVASKAQQAADYLVTQAERTPLRMAA